MSCCKCSFEFLIFFSFVVNFCTVLTLFLDTFLDFGGLLSVFLIPFVSGVTSV